MNASTVAELLGFLLVYFIPTIIAAVRRSEPLWLWIILTLNLLQGIGMAWLPDGHWLRIVCVITWLMTFGFAFGKIKRPAAGSNSST